MFSKRRARKAHRRAHEAAVRQYREACEKLAAAEAAIWPIGHHWSAPLNPPSYVDSSYDWDNDTEYVWSNA